MSNILTIKLTEFKSYDGSTYGFRIYDNYAAAYFNHLEPDEFNNLSDNSDKYKVMMDVIKFYYGYDEETNFFTDSLDNYSGIQVDGIFLDMEKISEIYNEGYAE